MAVIVRWGRHVKGSNWKELVSFLNEAKVKGGIINIEHDKNTLSLEVDEGDDLYLPLLMVDFEDRVELRYFHNPEKEMRHIEFDGNLEYEALITEDFDLVLRIAREFYDTGDVKSMRPKKDLPPAIDDYENVT